MAYRKGTSTLNNKLYWFLYFLATSIVFMFFVTMPSTVIETAIQPIDLDAVITKEILFQRMSTFSFPYGTEFLQYTLTNSTSWLYLSPKKFAYKLNDEKTTIFGNKHFYQLAKPLAKTNFRNYVEERNGIVIDIIYPKKYETFKTT